MKFEFSNAGECQIIIVITVIQYVLRVIRCQQETPPESRVDNIQNNIHDDIQDDVHNLSSAASATKTEETQTTLSR
jgi:hypothetical protein